MIKNITKWFYQTLDHFLLRKIMIVEGDALPTQMPFRAIVLAIEEDETWCIGLKCPCGCGFTIELPTIIEAKPRWNYQIDKQKNISVYPSVYLQKGCKSHFWIKRGKIIWCH
ncbi:DUF6527 family protein [Acinetobacter calcoaceticus]